MIRLTVELTTEASWQSWARALSDATGRPCRVSASGAAPISSWKAHAEGLPGQLLLTRDGVSWHVHPSLAAAGWHERAVLLAVERLGGRQIEPQELARLGCEAGSLDYASGWSVPEADVIVFRDEAGREFRTSLNAAPLLGRMPEDSEYERVFGHEADSHRERVLEAPKLRRELGAQSQTQRGTSSGTTVERAARQMRADLIEWLQGAIDAHSAVTFRRE